MAQSISRRRWFRAGSATALAGWWAAPGRSSGDGEGAGQELFFGDLHNHNAVGYAQGSLVRTFENARNHLDFFAFTPHGWWPDIGRYENQIENKWLRGFDVTRERWPEVLQMVRRFDDPGSFVAIAGYEWHSTKIGDYHLLFPSTDDAPYARIDDIRQLQRFAKQHAALMIPHHPANRLGHRGANLRWLDPEVSPVMEIFSEWGNAEHDRAPSPYIRHTEGGRWTRNTFQYFLSQGYRLGVVASTDDHLGYPGAYRQGLAAVWASELSRQAIFEALRSRRCYGVSGDRIELDFRLDEQPMGRQLRYVRTRRIDVAVTGWDQVDRVEIIKNNRVLDRQFPMDRTPNDASWREPVVLRFEYGWGPWPALDMTRTCDWDIHISVDGGRIEAVQPCFQSGPLEEDRRDRFLSRSERHVRLQSYTALRQQFEDYSQKGVALRVRGGPGTRVTVQLRSPAPVSLTRSFRELARSNEMLFTGPFPKESAVLHRLVFHDHYRTSYSITDEDEGNQLNWYYVRVIQANEQFAWSSPIWVEARGRS
ncbi:MAG TPA: DUF3604 domain-containing protein [Planctomycetaceae bacterium]|nr:DUF3604 domain-containing protein [Planctomycetaceae bacterium]HIQ21157.1 DUF3604 domain-containing protein [Planctomycetota bacterium]